MDRTHKETSERRQHMDDLGCCRNMPCQMKNDIRFDAFYDVSRGRQIFKGTVPPSNVTGTRRPWRSRNAMHLSPHLDKTLREMGAEKTSGPGYHNFSVRQLFHDELLLHRGHQSLCHCVDFSI